MLRFAGTRSLARLKADKAEVSVAVFVPAAHVLAPSLVLHQHVALDTRPPLVHLHDVAPFIRESLHRRGEGV